MPKNQSIAFVGTVLSLHKKTTIIMKKILLIEDNRDVRENIVEILELAAYKVFAAENGKIGVEIAVKETPDLIICDIMMPELDGYGVLHLLNKKQCNIGHTVYFFLPQKPSAPIIAKAWKMGADDYLTKPFDDIELLNAIEIRLKKSCSDEKFCCG
jgi:CRP/FNR family cyclic AMP-dependent transcriptional regulator